MTIHKRTPWMRGLIPTVRSTSVEREAPIKNIVSVRQRRAMPEITAPKAGDAIEEECVQNDCYDEIKDEPGDGDFMVFALEYQSCDEGDGNYPQCSGQFDGGGHFEGFFSVCSSCSYNRTGVVNGNCSPGAEFLLCHFQPVSDGGEYE